VHQIAKFPSPTAWEENFGLYSLPRPHTHFSVTFLDKNFTLDGNCSLDFIALIVVVEAPRAGFNTCLLNN
jgi:hypothetical protein